MHWPDGHLSEHADSQGEASNMNADSKHTKRLWLFGVIAAMGLMLGGPPQAYAQQDVAQTLKNTFQLHGYLENQEIIRSENYASVQRGVDTQPHRFAAVG